MLIRFDGQTVIVTGSASGIGKGIAREFADSGGNLVIADINEEGARKTAEELQTAFGVQAMPIRVDVTKKASTQEMAAKVIERFGRIDVLVNNAGLTRSCSLAEFPESDWDLTLSVNLKGYFLVGQALVPHMIAAKRGAIVNIASKTGLKGSADNSAYSASKGGVVVMTQGWARELAKHQIRVNSVCPGNVLYGSGSWNDDLKKAYAKKLNMPAEKIEQFYIDQVPLKRPCSVEDVGQLVVFLASEKASYITGCAYLVDGGQECR